MSPADIESRITFAARRLASARTREDREQAWTELEQLHRQRTPERVQRMERQQGLG